MERVVITGLGLATGLGLDLETSWQGILAGRSATRRFSLFDPEGLPSPFGVELPEGAEALFRGAIKKRRRSQMTRGTRLSVVVAGMALADAGLPAEGVDPARIGVVAGSTGTGYAPPEGEVDPQRILRNMASAPAAWISLVHRLEGPAFVVSTACSSGIYALAQAHGLIEAGICDVVLAGAADSAINRADVRGFCDLLALSENVAELAQASRPFDRRRDGFVIGEGGGYLVLERAEHAAARGARALARMPRPALSSEVYNIISPRPGGAGMARTMALCLEQAGVSPAEIDYVNAHGTSTPYNDRYESEAIKAVFGERAAALPVSSTKGATGHCLSGAAGVEAVLSVKALVEGVIPPTANLEQPDPELGLDFVPISPRPAQLRRVLCNAFAFGGHNGVCLFERP